jgi:hypothetical protein
LEFWRKVQLIVLIRTILCSSMFLPYRVMDNLLQLLCYSRLSLIEKFLNKRCMPYPFCLVMLLVSNERMAKENFHVPWKIHKTQNYSAVLLWKWSSKKYIAKHRLAWYKANVEFCPKTIFDWLVFGFI